MAKSPPSMYSQLAIAAEVSSWGWGPDGEAEVAGIFANMFVPSVQCFCVFFNIIIDYANILESGVFLHFWISSFLEYSALTTLGPTAGWVCLSLVYPRSAHSHLAPIGISNQ